MLQTSDSPHEHVQRSTTPDYRAPGTPDPAAARLSVAPAPVVALFGWVVPGGGYFLIGETGRGIIICVTIFAVFLAGLLIAGIRVVDVPGFDDAGRKVFVYPRRPSPNKPDIVEVRNTNGAGRWVLLAHPLNEIANKVWNVPQFMAGPIYLVSANFSVRLARPDTTTSPPTPGVPRIHGRLAEIGTLYLAVAGVLNLLAIIDSAHRAGQLQQQVAEADSSNPQTTAPAA